MASNVKWWDLPNNANETWYRDSGLRYNVFLGLGLCLAIATNLTLLSGFQAMPSWQKYFNEPKGALLGVYSASFVLPSIVTSFIGDFLSNSIGRRWCIVISCIIIFGGALVNTFAVTIGMWCAGRAIMGAGVGMIKVATPVLIQEISHPRLRAILGSCYQTNAYIGIFFAALMTFTGLYVRGDWGWRFPSLLQVVGPVIVMIVALVCPESPRWLVKNGRSQEALKILAALHANGDENDALVVFELQQIQDAIEKQESQKKASYLDFLRTPGNRRRLATVIAMACSLNWMGNGIITYYLAPVLRSVGITAPVQITLINAGLALWNLILAALAAIYCDKAGRRPLFLTSTVGMLASYAVLMGLSAGFASTSNRQMGIAVIPFLFIFFGFYDIAFTPLPVAYTVEILPFSIRSKGMALFTSAATLGNAFNQFVNPIALESIAWKYYAVYIAILAFYFCFIYLLFPETKRLSAEDAAMAFDYKLNGQPRTATSGIEHEVTRPDIQKTASA